MLNGSVRSLRKLFYESSGHFDQTALKTATKSFYQMIHLNNPSYHFPTPLKVQHIKNGIPVRVKQ